MLDLGAVDFAKGGGLVVVVAQDAVTGAVLMVAFADREAMERTVATGEMHYRSRSRGLWHKGATSGNVQRVVSLTLDCDGDAVLARVQRAGPACHTGMVSCFGETALAADALAVLDATVGARARSAAQTGAAGAPPHDNDRAEREAQRHPHAAGGSETTPTAAPARGAPPHNHDTLGDDVARHPIPAAGTSVSHPVPPPRPSYTARLLADRNLRLKKLGEEAAELVLACGDADAHRAAQEAADLVYHTLVAARAVGVSLDDLRRVLAQRAAPPMAAPGA